jgi:sec-independent protein translocase protein TatB
MFDITSSKLLLLAIVALLVIGPKDFPVLLRTIGKYVGIIRGHAREFRAQFDEAMRESELAQMKKDMESFARDAESTFNDSTAAAEKSFEDARRGVENSVGPDPFSNATPTADPNATPAAQPEPVQAAANGADGASPTPPAEPEASPAPEAAPQPATAAGGHQRIPEGVSVPAPEKAGA